MCAPRRPACDRILQACSHPYALHSVFCTMPGAAAKICSICHDEIEGEAAFLKCIHAFHAECLLEYSIVSGATQNTVRCPECRLTGDHINNLEQSVLNQRLGEVVVVPDDSVAAAAVPSSADVAAAAEPAAVPSSADAAAAAEPAAVPSSANVAAAAAPAATLPDDTAAASNAPIAEATAAAPGEAPIAEATAAAPGGAPIAEATAAAPGGAPSAEATAAAPGGAITADNIAELMCTQRLWPQLQKDTEAETQLDTAAGIDQAVCAICKLLHSMNKLEVKSAKQGTFKCHHCIRVWCTINRKMGTGYIPLLSRMSDEEISSFMARCHDITSEEIVAAFTDLVKLKEESKRIFSCGGAFQPLSYWERLGYDVKNIEERTKDCDKRDHPIFDLVYRVPIEALHNEDRAGTTSADPSSNSVMAAKLEALIGLLAKQQESSSGASSSSSPAAVAAGPAAGPAAEAPAEAASDTVSAKSSSSSASSSSSSSSKKKKKKGKHGKGKNAKNKGKQAKAKAKAKQPSAGEKRKNEHLEKRMRAQAEQLKKKRAADEKTAEFIIEKATGPLLKASKLIVDPKLASMPRVLQPLITNKEIINDWLEIAKKMLNGDDGVELPSRKVVQTGLKDFLKAHIVVENLSKTL